MLYLDTSALVKLVATESETAALQAFVAERTTEITFCSYLGHTELLRATRPHGAAVMTRARTLLAEIHLLDVTRQVLETAAVLDTRSRLRSLDAIHLATALQAMERLNGLVTYDQRMSEAASELGLPVAAPGRLPRQR